MGNILEDLEDSQDFSIIRLMQPGLHTRAENAVTLVGEFFKACLSHEKFPFWRCLLDGFLQKVRDKCGLDTSFGQANIKHYRKDTGRKMCTRNIEKPLGLAVGKCHVTEAVMFSHRAGFKSGPSYDANSSSNQVFGCRYPDGDQGVPGECKNSAFPVMQEQWLPVHIDYNRATMLTSLGKWSWLRGQLHFQIMTIK